MWRIRSYYYRLKYLPRRLLRDPAFLLILACLGFSFYAWTQRKKLQQKLSKSQAATKLTGGQVAQQLLQQENITGIKVKQAAQPLCDNYDPNTKTLALSGQVFSSNSLAALATAAQKTALALQDQHKDLFFRGRFKLTPLVNFLGTLALPLYAVGFFASMYQLTKWGMRLGLFAFIFPLLTLPIELRASQKALQLLEKNNVLNSEELKLTKNFLSFEALSIVSYPAMMISNLFSAIKNRNNKKAKADG